MSMVKEPVIFLMNMCKLEKHEYQLFKDCEFVTNIIRDGILL